MAGEEDIVILFIIGTLAMTILASGLILFVLNYKKKMLQQELEKQQITSEHQVALIASNISGQEKERERVSQEIHDSLGGTLSALKFGLKEIENKDAINGEREKIKNLVKITDQSIQETRRLTKGLSVYNLEKFGLYSAINSLAEELSAATNIAISLDSNLDNTRFNIELEKHTYRIIQELTNNAIKHAVCSKIEIVLYSMNNYLQIIVSDDGVGFEHTKGPKDELVSSGLGLNNIKSRVGLLDGKLSIESQPNEGSQILIKLPVGQ